MDDLIQFWLVIAVVAIGIINAARKKRKEEDMGKTTLPGKKIIKAPVVTKDIHQSRHASNEWKEWFLDEKKEKNHTLSKENKPSYKKRETKEKKKNPENPLKTSVFTSNFKLKNKEEARKAFIYSEIFNRKY